MVGLGLTLPRRVDRLLGTLERGGIEVGVRAEGFEPLVERFDRSTHRLVMGIIVAALINGAAVLVSAFRPAGWDGGTSFAMLFGFAIAAGMTTHFAARTSRKK